MSGRGIIFWGWVAVLALLATAPRAGVWVNANTAEDVRIRQITCVRLDVVGGVYPTGQCIGSDRLWALFLHCVSDAQYARMRRLFWTVDGAERAELERHPGMSLAHARQRCAMIFYQVKERHDE